MSVSTRGLNEYLHTRRDEIEAALKRVLPSGPDCPNVVATAIRYSVTAGGKRLRPVLCLASAEAVARLNDRDEAEARSRAMPAACAIELIHTYSLIHDDLPAMDNDTMRRGRPTLHVVVGEGMAILAGDGLLTEAFGLIAREPRTDDTDVLSRKLRVVDVIATAAGWTGMVGGQAIDLAVVTPREDGTLPPSLDAENLRAMHAKKTGALIRASAVSGAIMAGGDETAIAAIDGCAANLGLAFQIVDDILDVEGASADLGKTAGKDAAAGKTTYPALYGVDESRRMARDCVERAKADLSAAGLGDTRLVEIGHWIVERSS
jgi:geranylgeranyl diphosphate synthase type II